LGRATTRCSSSCRSLARHWRSRAAHSPRCSTEPHLDFGRFTHPPGGSHPPKSSGSADNPPSRDDCRERSLSPLRTANCFAFSILHDRFGTLNRAGSRFRAIHPLCERVPYPEIDRFSDRTRRRGRHCVVRTIRTVSGSESGHDSWANRPLQRPRSPYGSYESRTRRLVQNPPLSTVTIHLRE